MIRPLFTFLVFLLGASVPGLASSSSSFELRQGRELQSRKVIVEFHGVPVALSQGRTEISSFDDLFDRFRRDLAGGEVRAMSAPPPSQIRREFRTVFLGAAVEVHPAAIERLKQLPYVRSVRPDREMRALRSSPSVVSTAITDARARVNAIGLGDGGRGIRVAVIDTGIDYTHPVFGGGYGPGHKVVGGYDFINDDADPMDDNGHGTHVAGIVAADSPQLVGVAPNATLLGYKVLSAGGSGPMSDTIAAIDRALDPDGDGDTSDRVHVINLSLGAAGDAEDPSSRAVNNAVAAGVVVVVAAGNDGGVVTIASPGTARDAITVAAVDDEGRVTSFSSRGPSPRFLGFKPDIAAPGFQIVSSVPGGRMLALNGTSMSAPHVAGVAALLLALHPEWTPADVKAAMTSGAGAVNDGVFARGAGRVDARAAHLASIFADASGLSFGIRPSGTGTSAESQTLKISNRSAVAQTLTGTASGTPAGVSITLTPPTLQLAAGETGEVVVRLETANETLAFPNDPLMGGEITFSGSNSLRIPWGILRTARARVSYDGIAEFVMAIEEKGGRGPVIRDPEFIEIYLPPGKDWDFLLYGWDVPAEGAVVDTRRMIMKSGVRVEGDQSIEIRRSDAIHEVELAGRDHSGLSLSDRPQSADSTVHAIGLRLIRVEDVLVYSVAVTDHKEDARRLLFSAIPENYSLYTFEQFVDFEKAEAYLIEHETLAGLTGSRVMDGGGPELMRIDIQGKSSARGVPEAIEICGYDALTTNLVLTYYHCHGVLPRGETSLRLYQNRQRFPYAHVGTMFRSPGIVTQAFRGGDGEVIVSSEETPSAVSERIPAGSTYEIAAGPSFPFALPGTRNEGWFRFPWSGFYGSGREELAEREGIEWTTWDADGRQTAIGSLRETEGVLPPAPASGSRFRAVRNDLPTGDHYARGTLSVSFGDDGGDLNAPTLTSLRALNGEGRPSGRFAPEEAASLRFSIADLEYSKAATTKESRPEATRVWFRRSNGGAWESLPVRLVGAETGSRNSLRHLPAGDIHEADLALATRSGSGWLDLRIEFEDKAGNRVEWVQERAFAVGETPVPPRARGVRR